MDIVRIEPWLSTAATQGRRTLPLLVSLPWVALSLLPQSVWAACLFDPGATTWIAGSGSWLDPSKWSTGVVPNSSGTDVCITNPSSNALIDPGAVEHVRNLYVEQGNSIGLGSASALSVGTSTGSPNNLSLKGEIRLNASGAPATSLLFGGNTSVGGGGDVMLNTPSGGGGSATVNLDAWTVTNIDSTVQGSGLVFNGNLVNQGLGTVNANASGAGVSNVLQLNLSLLTNQGLLEASNGGQLYLHSTTINNASGNITANAGSTVLLDFATIQGGTLNNTSGGSLGTAAASQVRLDGSTTAGALGINGIYASGAPTGSTTFTRTYVAGTIMNAGFFQVYGSNAGGEGTMTLGANTMLQGGGQVELIASNGSRANVANSNGAGNALIELNGFTLTNVDNTIGGTGLIFAGNLVNQAGGVINAGNPHNVLTVNASALTNQGLMEASAFGELDLNGTINNAGGQITANPSATVLLGGNFAGASVVIQGGTLANSGGTLSSGALGSAGLDGITHGALTLTGTYTVVPQSTTFLMGTINNTGTMQVNGGSAGAAQLQLNGNTTLQGAGTIGLNPSGGGNAVLALNGGTLSNIDNTIHGAGLISGTGTLLNGTGGTILADVAGATLTEAATTTTNNGRLQVSAGATLSVASSSLSNFSGNTLTGGSYVVSGNGPAAMGILQLHALGSGGGEIVNNAAQITLNGADSQLLDHTGMDALSNLAANSAAGSSLTVNGGRSFTTAGGFQNAGALSIGATSTFTTGAAAGSDYQQNGGTSSTEVAGTLQARNYTQNAGTTQIDAGGKLTAATFNYNGGALFVNGTLDPLSLISCASCLLSGSGTVIANVTSHGTVSPGAPGAPGTLTINGSYTQAADGVLSVQIAGAGTGQFSVLDVSGTAALDGTVDFTAVGGFTPAVGDDFEFLVDGLASGNFSNIVFTNWTCPANANCMDVFGSNSVSLDIIAQAPVPVPASLMLLGSGLLGFVGLARKPRSARPRSS